MESEKKSLRINLTGYIEKNFRTKIKSISNFILKISSFILAVATIEFFRKKKIHRKR